MELVVNYPIVYRQDSLVREIVRDQLIESMPIKDQLLLEGISLPSIKDGIQFLAAGAAEYGLGAITMPAAGAGLAVGPTAETMVDSLFAAEEIMGTIEGVLDFSKSAAEFAGLIQSGFEAFGGKSLEAFYDTLKEIVQKGLALLGEKAGDAIDDLVVKLKATIKNIIDGILGALSAGIKLVIPDAAIGTLAAEGMETVLSALADNAFSIMAKTIGKIKLFADFVSDPSVAVDFFKDVFGQVIELVRQAGEKLENMSWLKTAGLTAVGGPGVIALKALGPTGLEKAADAIEKGLPTIMKLIDKVLTVLVPVMLACLGIFQILMKGEYKEKEGDEEGAANEKPADEDNDDEKKKAIGEVRRMKTTRQRLRRIIKEVLLKESTLFVTHGDYGYMGIKDDQGNDYALGEIVADLLDAGATDEIFMVKGQQMADSLARLKARRAEEVQGGIERWDPDVFDGYYDVDRDRAVQVWAVLNGHKVEAVEEEVWDEYPEEEQARLEMEDEEAYAAGRPWKNN